MFRTKQILTNKKLTFTVHTRVFTFEMFADQVCKLGLAKNSKIRQSVP